MQLHLGVERLVEKARKHSNRLKVLSFGGGKCEDAAVFDKEHANPERDRSGNDRSEAIPVVEAAHKGSSAHGPK